MSNDTVKLAPMFIVGYMHSGTTLLQEIISNHPMVYTCVGETKFFEFLPQIKRRFPRLDEVRVREEYTGFVIQIIENGLSLKALDFPGEYFWGKFQKYPDILKAAGGQNEHIALFTSVFAYLTKLQNKQRWLEKTPTHIFNIDEIIQAIPDALIIEIVRDPRAVLASKKTRRETALAGGFPADVLQFKRNEKAYDPLWDSLSWKAAIQAGLDAQKRYALQLVTVRYEDLVSQPEETVKAICECIGLPFEAQMLKVKRSNTAYAKPRQWKEGSISIQSREKWRGLLAGGDLSICQRVTRVEMTHYGYEFIKIDAAAALTIPLVLVRSGLEFIGRLWRRFRLGGSRFLFHTLANYWKRMGKLNG